MFKMFLFCFFFFFGSVILRMNLSITHTDKARHIRSFLCKVLTFKYFVKLRNKLFLTQLHMGS